MSSGETRPEGPYLRALVEAGGRPLAEIAREAGMSPSALRRRMVREGWKRPRKLAPPPLDLGGRLRRAALRQVEAIEALLEAAGVDPPARERLSRALASATTSLERLSRMGLAGDVQERDARSDDDLPLPLEELRLELSRRLDRLRRTGSPDGLPGDPDASGGEGAAA